MSEQTAQELRLAEILVEALELEDIEAHEIGPEAPLFGEAEGSLGLDSIDALEIALAIAENYNVELRADDEENKKVFASVRSLVNHIEAKLAQ